MKKLHICQVRWQALCSNGKQLVIVCDTTKEADRDITAGDVTLTMFSSFPQGICDPHPASSSHVKQVRFRLTQVVDWDSEANISGATRDFPLFLRSQLAIVGRMVSTFLFYRGYLSSSNPARVWFDRTGQDGDQAG